MDGHGQPARSVVYPREMERRLHELLADEPVVIVSGPRSVGKSFTSERVVRALGGSILRLDDPSERQVASADPTGYLQQRQKPVLLDEYQHVPELLGAIKAEFTRLGTTPGQYLLTGSVRADLAGATEWLTGRIHRARLYPLSQSELMGAPSSWFTTTVLESPERLRGWRNPQAAHSIDYINAIIRGGFPLAIDRTAAARRRWFTDYVQDTVLRDALEHANIRKPHEMLRLLTLLSSRTAQELKAGALENDLQLDRHTIGSYLEILSGLFLSQSLPPWYSNRSQRLVKAPKEHVTDTGMATALLGLDIDGLRNNLPLAGHLLESFVFNEVVKQCSWLDDPPTLYHYRERGGGAEVDLVLERADGAVIGLEVKLASSVGARDLTGIRRLRDVAGARFVGGVVLAAVPAAYVTEDDLAVAPIAALWASADGNGS